MPNKSEVTNFSLKIETLANDKGISCMDAIMWHCEQSGLEIELVGKLINKSLKTKIQFEAEELNFLPKSNTNKLPL
jgi:hypothetical protein